MAAGTGLFRSLEKSAGGSVTPVLVNRDLDGRRASANPFFGSTAKPLGNLIRLRPLRPSELPPHPVLARFQNNESSPASDRPQIGEGPIPICQDESGGLYRFIIEAIRQGWDFNDDTVEATFTKGSKKRSRPAKGKVRILSHAYTAEELLAVQWEQGANPRKSPTESEGYPEGGETWFARRSRHLHTSYDNHTAKFSEFENGLLHNHSANEMEYNPDVLDAHMVLSWRDQLLQKKSGIPTLRNMDMAIYEMVHSSPWPLRNRAFAVLVVSATIQRTGFIVVQIPVDLTDVPEALYSNGRNVEDGRNWRLRRRVVVGLYTSIERAFLGPDLYTWWQRATASDARGSVPQWMQKKFMPSKVRKDVGLFIKWTRDIRPPQSDIS